MRKALISIALAGAIGCTGEPEDTELTTSCEGDYLAFEPGMSVRTDQGNFDLVFVEATPNPPDEGDNDWVLRVDAVSGEPVNGAAVVVTPWMPAHGHGVSPPDYAGQATTGVSGEYAVPTFDLIMPGTWEFQILIAEGMTNDTVAPAFCIEG